VGEYLRGRFNPEQVWSSDLLRCTQTAEAIGLPFNRTEALREIHFGAWEGRLWMDLHREAPELTAKFVRGDPSFRPPGGEMLGELVERMGRFVRESGVLAADGEVAVIGHGGAMRALIVSLLGLPPEATARFHCGNCTVSVIASNGRGPLRLESLNESAHLDGGSG
jgi:broad specificity phosphatase PhoE